MRALIFSAALALALASCGGSNDPEPTQTPLPTSTPIPTSTPDPREDAVQDTVQDILRMQIVATKLELWGAEERAGSPHSQGDWLDICGDPNTQSTNELGYGYVVTLYWPGEYEEIDQMVYAFCATMHDDGVSDAQSRSAFAELIRRELTPLTDVVAADTAADVDRKVREEVEYWYR